MNEDWIEEELQRKRMEEKDARRERMYRMEQRTTRLGYFATAIFAGLVIGAIVLAIAWGVTSHAQSEHEERIACNEAGGTFVPLRPEGEICLVGVEQREEQR